MRKPLLAAPAVAMLILTATTSTLIQIVARTSPRLSRDTDRTSAATMRANQLRLWFASMAYALLSALRRRALAATCLARATCGTIRAKLLKIGALVTVSVRRVRVAMASACPYAAVFRLAHRRLSG